MGLLPSHKDWEMGCYLQMLGGTISTFFGCLECFQADTLSGGMLYPKDVALSC